MKKITPIIVPMAVVAAFGADYLFPSSNPPGGKSPSEVEQYATIIWDDNAYSGKAGTNYEGPSTVKFQFQTNNWINKLRSEGGWVTTDNKNELDIVEGDIGMSWATYTLAGQKVYPYTVWSEMNPYSPQVPDTVIHNDSIWACVDWPISTGTKTVTSKTVDGRDTTVTINSYNPPRLLDTTSGTYTVTKKVIDEESGQWIDVEQEVAWSELESWDKTAIREQYKAWSFVEETDQTLTRKNPDGTPIRFTFNVISGLMTPTFPVDWQARESKFGYYVPNDEFYEDGYAPNLRHSKIAVSWGREMPIYESSTLEKVFTEGYITQAFAESHTVGHEIGNHTIDHMESNSPLPQSIYEQWNSDRATNGFDYSLNDTMPWGEVVNEAEQFGQKPGNVWQTMGWKMYAGKYISKDTWKGAIALSEKEMDEYLGLSVAKGNLGAFRAPRLEVNSNLYFALSELGYQYDCGLEDGYEQNVHGGNFLWPYTLDNGNPNATYQRAIGEDVSIDSMPAGLWQIPSNVFVVPESVQDEVYANHALINAAAADGEEIESLEDWSSAGAKITGYDFNLYILWGMKKSHWLETMKHNINLRIAGNKAPLHYGAHTDYYTPIYDYATLLNDQNASSYGLNVTNKWNTWEDRITSMEEWIDWATTEKNVHFVTGRRLIEEIKKMQEGEVFGAAKEIQNLDWTFENNSAVGSSSDVGTATNSFDAQVTVKAAAGNEFPNPRFTHYQDAGFFSGMTHIQVDYQTTAPLYLRVVMDDYTSREVILGSLGNKVASGKIPLSAFKSHLWDEVQVTDPIDPSKIIGLELKIVTAGKEQSTERVKVDRVVLYGAEGGVPSAINDGVRVKQQAISVRGMSRDQLSLSVPVAGNYDISIVGLNGRVMAKMDSKSLTAGINNLNLAGLSTGVYLVQVKSQTNSIVLKSFVN